MCIPFGSTRADKHDAYEAVPTVTKRLPFIERFWASVRKSDGCWEWASHLTPGGYGKFYMNGKHHTASRLSYKLAHGEFDPALSVLHKCDNAKCVRPEHLYLGTQKDNIRDKYDRGRQSNTSGERNARHKITAENVKTMRHLYWAERRTQAELARFYGISAAQVHNYCSSDQLEMTTQVLRES